MGIERLVWIVLLISGCGILGCSDCEPDAYGDTLELVLPINTYPNRDTLQIGDTLWIEGEIDKNVEVRDVDRPIFLEGFNFFSEFGVENLLSTGNGFVIDAEVFAELGEVTQLPLQTAIVYPMVFDESDSAYRIKVGIVFNDTGVYFLRFSYDGDIFQYYSHPALFQCEDKRRYDTRIYFRNMSTNQESFESIFQAHASDIYVDVYDYLRYSDLGAVTFVVTE